MNGRPLDTVCALCYLPAISHSQIFNTALYNKYSAMIEYRTYHDINTFVEETPCHQTLLLEDRLLLDGRDEYLKGYNKLPTIKSDIMKGLLKYYKYHISLPVCYLENVGDIVEKHQTLRLRLYYRNVKKKLRLEVSNSQSEKSKNKDETPDDLSEQSCSCVLCCLANQDGDAPSRINPHYKRIIRSQSKELFDMLSQLSFDTNRSKSYLQASFIKDQNKSKSHLQSFEQYLDSMDLAKRREGRISQKDGRKAFLKKNTIPVKDLRDILNERKSIVAVMEGKKKQNLRKQDQQKTTDAHSSRNIAQSSKNQHKQTASTASNLIKDFMTQAIDPISRARFSQGQLPLKTLTLEIKDIRGKSPSNKASEHTSKKNIMPPIHEATQKRRKTLIINNSKEHSPVEITKLRQKSLARNSILTHENPKAKTEERYSNKKIFSLERMKTSLHAETPNKGAFTTRTNSKQKIQSNIPFKSNKFKVRDYHSQKKK